MKTKTTYKFRLSSKDAESGLKLHVDDLASRRVLTDEIKTALTLLAQLRNGNRQLLDSMFPNICATPQPPPSDSGDMEKRIADMVAKQLEGKLQQSRPMKSNADIPDTRDYGIPAMKQSGQGIGKLASHTIALPVIVDDDDDDATIVLNAAAYQNTGANLIAGILGMEVND